MKLIAYTRNLLFLHHNDSMFNKNIIYINLLPFKNATTKLLSYKSSKRNRESLDLNICFYTLNLAYSFLAINNKKEIRDIMCISKIYVKTIRGDDIDRNHRIKFVRLEIGL